MADVDPRLVVALRAQLGRRRAALAAGARHVGWKVGCGERERIGPGPVIGHLTTSTLFAPGATFRADGVLALHADAEVFLELGPGGTIAGYGAALELCDLGHQGSAEAIVASNVFHRAVGFGPVRDSLRERVEGRLVVNGEERARAVTERDYEALLGSLARLLATVGERLAPGDRIITGSVVQVPLAPGDEVSADFGPLGRAGALVA